MKEATRKATSTRKDISGAIAQMLAVTAMLMIAGFAFFGRATVSTPASTIASDRAGVAPAMFTERSNSATGH